MKLAIVGYGKMGRLIEQLAPEYGFEVGLKLDTWNNANYEGITAENFRDIDVAVEFSTPEAVLGNIERIARLGVNLVVGTTGWFDHLEEVRKLVQETGIGFVWSPNYSVGVNIFFQVVREAAHWFARHPEYEAWGWEIHHSAKKDAPSGTMIKLVDLMKQAGYERAVNVASNRAGAHPGTHEIGFDSSSDTVTLRHTARSREGFARGALWAARWIVGRRGFYDFSQILFGRESV